MYRNKPRAIKQLTRAGELVEIHHSVYAAVKAVKDERPTANATSIRAAAEGKMPTAYNYRWEFVETAETE